LTLSTEAFSLHAVIPTEDSGSPERRACPELAEGDLLFGTWHLALGVQTTAGYWPLLLPIH